MNHTYHLTRVSANSKTGPIPVSTTSSSTCPVTCPLKNNGCYAEHGKVGMHWRKVSSGERGGDVEQFAAQIKRLPRHQLWRYGQAGDLPGDGHRIDAHALAVIVEANKGRRGFAYTHYPVDDPANAAAIAAANAAGFTINLSANNLDHADELAVADIGPVVVLLPPEQTKPTLTPAGRHVSVCPASIRDDIDCARCGVCATDRVAIIGFPAHGSGKAKAHKVFSIHRSK